jgi:hypothetical protein
VKRKRQKRVRSERQKVTAALEAHCGLAITAADDTQTQRTGAEGQRHPQCVPLPRPVRADLEQDVLRTR